MDLGLTGKRALILGGSKGIGRAVAEALAAEGSIVAIVGRDQEALREAVAGLQKRSPRSTSFSADLSRTDGLSSFLKRVDEELGDVDVLLLNGGGPPPLAAANVDPSLWRAQFEALVLSGMMIAAHCLPGMRRRKWGRILVVASTSVREPIGGLTVSNALRSAVAGWAKTLATEVAADGVTVNLLLPGRITTNRTARLDLLEAQDRGVDPLVIAAESQAEIPAQRYGLPAEVGAMAAFLASAQAQYVTGVALAIDGGLSRSLT
jgi:3-oxoacyl-[acyl-carrier protein] reductase